MPSAGAAHALLGLLLGRRCHRIGKHGGGHGLWVRERKIALVFCVPTPSFPTLPTPPPFSWVWGKFFPTLLGVWGNKETQAQRQAQDKRERAT